MQRLLVLAALVLAPASSAAPIYFALSGDAGYGNQAAGVSADGKVVVGTFFDGSGQQAFRWTQGGGMVSLGPGEATGVSGDGSVVVGLNGQGAFRWTQDDGMVSLGTLPGTTFSSASGVSADGAVVVGGTSSPNPDFGEAFRWTQPGGMVGLGDLPESRFHSVARGVSADGSVVVGQGTAANFYFQAFRWTQDDGMIGLGSLPGGSHYSDANAVSADGKVVVGQGSGPAGYEAFRWTELDGMVGLGDLPGGEFRSEALAASADGSVVVGTSIGSKIVHGAVGVDWQDPEGFIWDAAGGMRRMPDFPGVRLSEAVGISADGTTIVGNTTIALEGSICPLCGPTYSWIVIIPEPGTGLLVMTGVLGLVLSRRRRAN